MYLLSLHFLHGLICACVALLARAIFNALSSPSIKALNTIACKPLKRVGDDGKITIFSPRERDGYGDDGIPDFSPFVNRVEAYLRLLKQPFERGTTKDLSENPRHKYPFANIKGVMVDDSSRIIAQIQRELNIHEKLTSEQAQTAFIIRRLLTQNLYFVMLHQVFQTESGRKMHAAMWKDKLPWFIHRIIMKMVEREEVAQLHGQGYGRYPEDFVVQQGKDDLHAISTFLGDQKFLLGTEAPSSIDTDLYAFLCPLCYDPWASKLGWVVEIRQDCPNLVSHTDRMKSILYPEAESLLTAAN